MAYTQVALFTSAWIETGFLASRTSKITVALFTSAWIETVLVAEFPYVASVALFTSAWIETDTLVSGHRYAGGRALHERVD